jgi:hypothetical protein
LPFFADPQLSPNGDRIAVILMYKDRNVLVDQKLDQPGDKVKEPPTVIYSGQNFINWYNWANDDRLIVSLRASVYDGGNLWNISRIGSFSRHKGEEPIMFKMRTNADGVYRQNAEVVSFPENDPDHILAALDDVEGGWAMPNVDRVNVYTGERTLVARNSMGFYSWLADKNGNLRIGVKADTESNSSNVTIYYRETENDNWEILQKADNYDNDRLLPLRFDEDDPNILLLTTVEKAEEESSHDPEEGLFRYDLT